ncbi:MAG: tetratricopeptide repeat protein [Acidobacteria bacterium]|nr:tetratricopeptide repeat protein [Acidobacteriota bacterium]MCA1619918.1 tetratricopeptide repeat protein [Acidobacteriota bacterium]
MARKSFLIVAFALCALASGCARATPENISPSNVDSLLPTVSAGSGPLSRADRQLGAARAYVESRASDPKGYNLLAAAYMQKAREAEDFGVNAKAMEALDRSLRLAPDNYDALKLRAKLLLTFHRFEEGLEVARRAQALNPRDHDNYGALTDALVELGEYTAAVEAAQMMVDLRPDTSSYARVSYLRWLHGDTRGAVEAMRLAAQSVGPQEPERVAWCHVQLGEALLSTGEAAEAEREFDRALFVFPGYGAALDAKARARVRAGDLEGALEIYRGEHEADPSADTALALGDLYAKLGREDEAARHYATFESLEPENAAAENDMHHLVAYWTDHDKNLDEALALARKERERRKDVYTCDALAWALYKKGLYAEAKAASEEALRLGTRDPRLLYHAGMIAYALGERGRGADYLRQALAINPAFDVLQADVARRTLGGRPA